MFKGGSSIRPASPDFRGFSNAAQTQAESMARIGASIAGAVEQHQEKKKLKETNTMFDQMVLGFASGDSKIAKALQSIGLVDAESIAASRKGLGKKELLEFITFLTEMESKEANVKPASFSTMNSAQEGANELGFKFNEDTNQMEREVKGDTTFGGHLRNIFSVGTPGTPTRTEAMPEEMIQGITGMPQLIRNKQMLNTNIGAEEVSGNETDTVLMVDREGLPRRVAREDVEEAIQNGYRL